MYQFKNYAVRDRVGFAEVYGMPLRVVKYEPGASKADRDALIKAVRSLGTAGINSKSTEIEFIEARKGCAPKRLGKLGLLLRSPDVQGYSGANRKSSKLLITARQIQQYLRDLNGSGVLDNLSRRAKKCRGKLREIIMSGDDSRYLKIVLDPIYVCAKYRPKFGQGKSDGLTLKQFQGLYQGDPFYHWFGLDNPLMYAAHKAAGGMTSVYRQIGIGCEALFCTILQDMLGLSAAATRWSYEVPTPGGKIRTLRLDGRVPLEEVKDNDARRRFHNWMELAAAKVGVDPRIFSTLTGTVFEVRQGYKSKDSKRQNADIANAATAYIKAYLPCAVILSTQIDADILLRYRAEKWAVIIGTVGVNDPLISTYDFMREIVGYELAAFFKRNRKTLRMEIDKVLQALLAPDDSS